MAARLARRLRHDCDDRLFTSISRRFYRNELRATEKMGGLPLSSTGSREHPGHSQAAESFLVGLRSARHRPHALPWLTGTRLSADGLERRWDSGIRGMRTYGHAVVVAVVERTRISAYFSSNRFETEILPPLRRGLQRTAPPAQPGRSPRSVDIVLEALSAPARSAFTTHEFHARAGALMSTLRNQALIGARSTHVRPA
jgi:hypothetical protein